MMRRIWSFFASTGLTVTLAVLVCIVTAWGSITVVRNQRFFQEIDHRIFLPWLFRHGTESPGLTLWMFVLVLLISLFAVNTFVCTADRLRVIIRNRRGYRAFLPQVVHIGFLVALAGHLVGSTFGFRSPGVVLAQGRAVPVPHTADLSVRLDDVDVAFTPRGGLDRLSTRLTLIEGGTEVRTGTVRINGPLVYKGIAFYHANQGRITTGLVLDVDGERVEVEFDGGFTTAAGKSFTLGRLYPDLEIDRSGRPYSRSARFRNPYQEIIAADGSSALLGIARPGGTVDLGGTSVTLVDYVVSPYVVLNIHKDPGIWLIMAGSMILVGGMVLLLLSKGERGELLRRPSTG